jgi:hypothetical protein
MKKMVWLVYYPRKYHKTRVVKERQAPPSANPMVPIRRSGFKSRNSQRNGPWLLSSLWTLQTLNYTTLPVQLPRLSLCLSRSVRHGRGWGRSHRLGATAPRRSSPVGCLRPTPLLRRCYRSCCRHCCRRRWWRCCRCCGLKKRWAVQPIIPVSSVHLHYGTIKRACVCKTA